MAERDEVLGATRVESGPARAPGSKQVACYKCGAAVWIAPTSQALLKARPHIKVVCFDPCLPLLDELRDGVEIALIPGSVAEVKAWLDGKLN